MSSVLYHPVNASIPAWASRTTHEGHKCDKIDAQGGSLVSCKFYRFPPPQSNDINVEISLYLANFLNASGNGYEGVTVQLRAIRLDGETQTVTYNNNVLVSGDINKWQWEKGDWRRFSVIEQLPSGVEADFIDICVIVKAPSGFVYIRNVECRNRYERRYLIEVEGPATAGGSSFVADNYGVYIGKKTRRFSGINNWRRLWYLQTIPINIKKDEKIAVNIELSASGTAQAVEGGSVGAILKFRNTSGDYTEPGGTQLVHHFTGNLIETFLTLNGGFIAWEDYTQVEFIMFMARADYADANVVLNHQGVDCEIIVEQAISND